MKSNIINAALLTVAGSLVPATALAAGYQVNEHNAAATGRAGAVVATVKDPSAIFYNPAGLVHTKGTQVQVGATVIRPSGTYTGAGIPSARPPDATGAITAEAVQGFVPVPNLYASHALSDKAFVGVGLYFPYGLGIEWENPDSFIGRTVVQELSLRTTFITPTIALKLSDRVSLAVSVSLVPASLYLRRVLGAADNGQVLFPSDVYGSEGTVEMSGSAFGVGANAGLQVALSDKTTFGFSFRSAVGLDFAGSADFVVPDSVPKGIAANFQDGDINGELTLPHSFSFGLGHEDGDLTIEASVNVTLWTAYDELRINFDSGLPSPSSASRRDWKTTPTFRVGGQYQLGEMWTIRAGAAYDVTPVPDETIDVTLPDQDRLIFTLGLGGKFGPVQADLAYMLLAISARPSNDSVNFPAGVYEARRIDLFGLTLGMGF